MARYFTVRGFLDCDDDELEAIRVRLSTLRQPQGVAEALVRHVRSGWVFHTPQTIGLVHVFYGNTVTAEGYEVLRADIANLMFGLSVEGIIFTDDEELEMSERLYVRKGAVTVMPWVNLGRELQDPLG